MLNWKDTLLPGGSRKALPWVLHGPVLPGYAGDENQDPVAGYQQRNDWVAGPGGRPVISGSSESQVGAGAPVAVPSAGFSPVDAGQYGANPYFAGRSGSLLDALRPLFTQVAVPPGGFVGGPGFGPGGSVGVTDQAPGLGDVDPSQVAFMEWLRKRAGLKTRLSLGPDFGGVY